MSSLSRPSALVIVLLSLSPVGAAFFADDPSDGYPVGDCRGQIVQVGPGDATPFATVYWVIVGNTPDNAFGYIEMNDEAGLQRGYFNDAPGILNAHDICFESDYPDFMWY